MLPLKSELSALDSSAPSSPRRDVSKAARLPGLWPREHGAYAQLAFPLVTALAHARWNLTVLAFTLGAIAVFLLHEPAQVLLGNRGGRAFAALGGAAWRRLILFSSIAVAAGSVGLLTASRSAASAAFWALGVGLVAAVFVVLGRGKTVLGECLAAVALSFAALPVAVAGQVPVGDAVAFSAVWSLVFVMSTCAVQVVIAATKRKNRGAVLARTGTFLLSVMVPSLALLSLRGALLAPGPVLALLPVSAICVGLSLKPPHARWLRQIGWGVVAACTTALVALVAA